MRPSFLIAALFLALSSISSSSQAQAPDTLSIQGVLTDAAGDPLPDGDYHVLFRLYEVPTGGTAVWTENHTGPNMVPVEDGVFNVTLGRTTGFVSVRFDRQLYLGVKVGGDPEMTPRAALTAVPYAMALPGMYTTIFPYDGDFVAYNVIGGGPNNYVAPEKSGATIGGGGGIYDTQDEPNRVLDHFGTIGGGAGNTVESYLGTIAGGFDNTILATQGSIGGGQSNSAAYRSTIGGGYMNQAIAQEATIGGGHSNQAMGPGSTVGGGLSNQASDTSSTVSGGENNQVFGFASTIGGGQGNLVEATFGTIAGGYDNHAGGGAGSVGGGTGNKADNVYSSVGGGVDNWASGRSSMVGGGQDNVASGQWATIPGGLANMATDDFAFAAGHGAKANHQGTFVWSSGPPEFVSTGASQFLINADGGVGIGTNSPHAGSQLDVEGPIYAGGTTMLYKSTSVSGTVGQDDGIRLRYDGAFGGSNNDYFVIEKTDANQNDPDGGVAFVNTGADGIAETALTISGSGNVSIPGTLTKGSGSFKIDHPLDPLNRFLYHSFVESPDMKNVYDGVATLDAAGEALVSLPSYFEALNREFRYQLTCIGGFAPVYVAEEVSENQFRIAGGRPGMKVSWQLTGIRKDPYAVMHPIEVEVDKGIGERGTYLHPDAYRLAN